MESLWLPWVLANPLTASSKWLFSPSGAISLATACPLFVLIPGANILAAVLFGFIVYQWYRDKSPQEEEAVPRLNRTWERSLTAGCSPLLFLPFVAAILFTSSGRGLKPPENVQQKVLEGMGYALRVEGQPKDLGLLWYDPQGSDRHHAVEVCLQYRGVELKESEVGTVKTDGDHWYCEFFIVRDKLVDDHSKYIWETLGFRQDPGVHLILVGKHESFTAEDFAKAAKSVAGKLHKSLKDT